MKLGDWRTIGGPGVLPMQTANAHKFPDGGASGNFLDKNNMKAMDASTGGILGLALQAVEQAEKGNENVNLWERPCLFGVRILDRDEDQSDIPIGRYIEDPETRGDIIGSTFWDYATRDIGFWRWSTPAVTGDQVNPRRGDAGANASTSGGIQNLGTGYASGKDAKNSAGLLGDERDAVKTGGKEEKTGGKSYDAPDSPLNVGPIKKITEGSEWVQDKRVASIAPTLPKNKEGKELWPKFPKEYFGIVLSADWEDEQQELFFSGDPRLIAVHKNEEAAMGSLVCDMGGDTKLDPDRMGRLQAFAWTIKKPTGEIPFYGENSIAWNIGTSGMGDVRGGLIIDKDSDGMMGGGGTPTGGKGKTNFNPNMAYSEAYFGGGGGGGGGTGGPLGLVSQRQSGPLEIPCWKHELGQDEDGNKIYPTHLSMNSYFSFPKGSMDGPLKHDGQYVPPDEAPELTFVWFGYDSKIPHPFVGGGNPKGMHRWWANTNKYSPPQHPPGNPVVGNGPAQGAAGMGIEDGTQGIFGGSPLGPLSETARAAWTFSLMGGKMPFANARLFNPDGGGGATTKSGPPKGKVVNSPHGIPLDWERIGETLRFYGGEGGGFEELSGLPMNPGPGNPFRETVPPVTPPVPPTEPPDDPNNPPPDGPPPNICGGSNQYAQGVAPYTPDLQRAFLPYQYSSMEEGGISYIWRPQMFQNREIDWRKWKKPNREYRRATADIESPITARFEAFGAQGASNQDTDLVLEKASDWIYTNRPNSYRYLSGTADGGICLLPPEIDLADIDNELQPITENVDVSTTHLIAARGTRFGTGLPDLFHGGVYRGYSFFDGQVGGQHGGLIFASNTRSTKTDHIYFEYRTGHVGLNQDSPLFRLHITDDDAGARGERIENLSNNSTAKAMVQTRNNTGDVCEMSTVSSGWPVASIPGNRGSQVVTDSRSFYLAATHGAGNMMFVTGGTTAGTTGNERMRITSAGDVGVKESSPDTLVHIHDDHTSGHEPPLLTQIDILKIESDFSNTGDEFSVLFTGNSVNRGRINGRIDGATTGSLVFETKDALAFRDALILEGDTGNVGINGESFASGQGGVFIANAAAPPSGTPSGGGILYVRAGALRYKGSAGTDTLIASA